MKLSFGGRLVALALGILPLRRHNGAGRLSDERAAGRAEAYIYGNIVELVVIATLDLHDVETGRAIILALGAAVATYIAHVIAATFGHRLRSSSGAAVDHGTTLNHLRDALPIATAGVVPGILLLLGFAHVLPVEAALVVSVLAFVVRFLLLGPMIAYIEGERLSRRIVLTGVVLALAAVTVAVIELLLLH